MEIFRSLDEVNLGADPRPKIVCIGMFDGVHLGHRALIAHVVNQAREQKGLAVAFAFQNHPLRHLAPAYAPPLLTPCPLKAAIFEQLGLDMAVIVPFDERIMRLSPGEFVSDILIARCDAAEAACGYDFRFGINAAGNPETLHALMSAAGRKAYTLPKVKIKDVTVSSTLIRDLIGERRMSEVPKYLGDYFRLEGRVVPGRGRGRTIGFPTANIEAHPDALIPPRGVYAAWAMINGEAWPGMLNIGRRPTFETEGEKTIEIHAIGFSGDIAGQTIQAVFLDHLRPERKFDSAEALTAQLQRDRAKALAVSKRAANPGQTMTP